MGQVVCVQGQGINRKALYFSLGFSVNLKKRLINLKNYLGIGI